MCLTRVSHVSVWPLSSSEERWNIYFRQFLTYLKINFKPLLALNHWTEMEFTFWMYVRYHLSTTKRVIMLVATAGFPTYTASITTTLHTLWNLCNIKSWHKFSNSKRFIKMGSGEVNKHCTCVESKEGDYHGRTREAQARNVRTRNVGWF